MDVTPRAGARTGRTFMVLAGLVASLAILLLAINVSREIRLLGSAHSDNVQWSLAQIQVEFLEFSHQVNTDPPDLARLRQEYDVFYSRMTTVQRASTFADLRADAVSRAHLGVILAFLDESVVLIDAEDEVLVQRLPELAAMTAAVQPAIRAIGHTGLKLFARAADAQRGQVALTMMQLAAAIVALIGVLALVIIWLNRMNARIYRREREQNQMAMRMQTVIGTSLDGVIVSDSNGLIQEFSPAAEVIFGHREADVLGKSISDVIVPDHMRAAHDAGMERMRTGGERRVVGKGRVRLEARRADGSLFPVELALQSATTDQGEIIVAFLRDISHRVAAEAELVSARDKALAGEKLKTDFLSTMSHEIRTPLNGLLGNMSLLRDTALTPAQDRYVSRMETSGRLLMSHISDVLDIAQYDAGKLTTRSEPVDISALLQDIVDNQSSTADRNETSLTWRWQGAPLNWILSDRHRLQHVLMNLVGNAVKFTRRGKVSVRLKTTGEAEARRLHITITDTGPGISEDLATHVFDDFVTGNTAYDRDVGGTGLGLSIAKRFVTALGGSIGVESVLGEGSTFWVDLPVTEAQAPEQTSPMASVRGARRPLDVLLVEDNEINRIVAREMLQAEGHRIVEARDGQEGVALARSRRFDLILMDISMPVMDGRAATRLIRSEGGRSAGATIVALTANAMLEEQQEFIADGMDRILTKPLSRDALRRVLEEEAPEVEAPTETLVNHAHSAETREALGEETFVKLRSRFVEEVETLQTWLHANDTHDFLEISARAHNVAGSAAVFGAEQLRDTLKRIEVAAKAGDSHGLAALVGTADAVWKNTKAELNS